MLTEELKALIRNEEDLIMKSNILIECLFKDVVDKSGKPYIGHLTRVGDKFKDDLTKSIGYLHDTIEDTDMSDKDLLSLGFPKEVVDSVSIVSRTQDETYEDFINRIIKSEDKLAISVKISDLEDNMDMKRIQNPTEKDYERLEKYKKAYRVLSEKIKGE